MIYKEINNSQFHDEFHRLNRQDNFSYEARNALFEYYDELGEDFELDVIAICCDWNELNEDDIRKEYDLKEDENVESYLNNQTYVIKLENGNYLFQAF